MTGAEAVGSSAPANVVKDAWGDRVADVTPRRGWWEEASTGPMCAVDGDDGSEHHQYQVLRNPITFGSCFVYENYTAFEFLEPSRITTQEGCLLGFSRLRTVVCCLRAGDPMRL